MHRIGMIYQVFEKSVTLIIMAWFQLQVCKWKCISFAALNSVIVIVDRNTQFNTRSDPGYLRQFRGGCTGYDAAARDFKFVILLCYCLSSVVKSGLLNKKFCMQICRVYLYETLKPIFKTNTPQTCQIFNQLIIAQTESYGPTLGFYGNEYIQKVRR